MSQTNPNNLKPSTEKPGFFTRIFSKMDSAMKEKADAKAQNSSCCSGKDSKGNKCC